MWKMHACHVLGSCRRFKIDAGGGAGTQINIVSYFLIENNYSIFEEQKLCAVKLAGLDIHVFFNLGSVGINVAPAILLPTYKRAAPQKRNVWSSVRFVVADAVCRQATVFIDFWRRLAWLTFRSQRLRRSGTALGSA